MSTTHTLTPTSYLVLGLLAREGPSTPYDLKAHVEATLGNFWSFQHTLLYTTPPALAASGLVKETREQGGRHRRLFEITEAGREALSSWLDEPSTAPSELRDLGLLQLFFADMGSPEARQRIANRQLALHRAKLDAYQHDDEEAARPRRSGPPPATVERWRGETLRMGILYEQAAIAFWESITRGAE